MREDSININIGQWIRDTAGSTLEAQGLYLRLRFIMNKSFDYGKINISPGVCDESAIAEYCGCTVQEYRSVLGELIENRVLRKDGDHILFCRRMVSKERTRQHFKKVFEKPKYDAFTEQRFTEIWGNYPLQIGRDRALKHFAETVKSPADWADICLALTNYKKQIKDPAYTVHGGNWFGRWREYVRVYSPPSPLEEETRKKAAWQSKGLSKCHGAQLFSDDGTQRCATCRMSQ